MASMDGWVAILATVALEERELVRGEHAGKEQGGGRVEVVVVVVVVVVAVAVVAVVVLEEQDEVASRRQPGTQATQVQLGYGSTCKVPCR